MSKRARKIAFPLIILTVLLFTAVLASGISAQPSIDEFIDLSITSSSPSPVPVGQPVKFDVELRNIGNQDLKNIVMPLTWDDASVAQVRMNVNQSTHVRTDGVRRQPGMVTWKGGLQKEGVLSVTIELTPAYCKGGDVSMDLMGEAGPAAGEQRVEAFKSMPISCAYDLNPNDLSIVMGFDTWHNQDETAFAMAGRPAQAQLSVENKSDGRINALIAAAFAPKDGQEGKCSVYTVKPELNTWPIFPAAWDFVDDSFTYASFMALEIEPGATLQVKLQVPLRGRIPGCEFSAHAEVYAGPAIPIPGSCTGESPECRYQGWTPRGNDLQALIGNLPKWMSDPQTVVLVAPDLGDAPTSANSFESDMEAYSGVKANFPTVFNFNIGMPPSLKAAMTGPFHRESRPIRLGNLVTRERDADLNPGRNINPETGYANLDRRDDSLNFSEVSGLCQEINLSVPITVDETAFVIDDAVRIAYLNLFVDADHSGDWGGAFQCNGQTMPEHVVINHPVDIESLGVGQHVVDLPPIVAIMFETFMESWVRVSISEAKAPTPLNSGGIAHGDGRGPADGYLLGETEDYYVRYGNQTNALDLGADMALRMDGFLSVESSLPEEKDGAFTIIHPLTATVATFNHQIRYGNLGDSPAVQSKLVVMPDPALRLVDHEIFINGYTASDPDNLDSFVQCAAEDPDCKVEVNLGVVPPGHFGTILVTATAICGPESGAICEKSQITTQAMVETAGDPGGGNNQAQKTWDLPLPVTWLAPPAISSPIPGTTSNEDLVIEGIGMPDRKVVVGVNGKKAGEDGDKDGPWKVTAAPGEGNYEVRASYESPGGKLNPTAPVSVVMSGGTTMIIDPMSIRVDVKHGNDQMEAIPWDSNGRVDPNGWQLPLLEETTAEISIEPSSWIGCLTCTLALVDIVRPLTATLTLPSGQILTTMSVDEKDGLLRGSFGVNSSMLDKPVALNVNFEGVQQVYEGSTVSVGELPQVIDGSTGQPVEGAKVVLWQAARDGDSDGADFLAWMRRLTVNGQPNPRITGNDGTFFFDVSPGWYRLEIIADDNSPSFWTEPQRLFGIYPSRTFVIMPDPKLLTRSVLTAVEPVSISEDGFDPPVVMATPGSEVEFVNLDLSNRGAHATDDSVALHGLEASHSDAPLVAPGGRFRIRFAQPGTYRYEDPQDPQNVMTVIVEPGEANSLFMPVLVKN